ncbi:hypothetical protein [Parasphingopyxis sp.]|uniref:hypothetical protein n=1 Tax=Parasphingopyxis sp. TaxID=1920299 RepID=UPI0026294D5D|nr:hypothetical protein [Parasphingopyxis sp.]
MKHKRRSLQKSARAPFPKETLEALEQLGLVLRTIHLEMKRAGYAVIDGKPVKLTDKNEESKKDSGASASRN